MHVHAVSYLLQYQVNTCIICSLNGTSTTHKSPLTTTELTPTGTSTIVMWGPITNKRCLKFWNQERCRVAWVLVALLATLHIKLVKHHNITHIQAETDKRQWSSGLKLMIWQEILAMKLACVMKQNWNRDKYLWQSRNRETSHVTCIIVMVIPLYGPPCIHAPWTHAWLLDLSPLIIWNST